MNPTDLFLVLAMIFAAICIPTYLIQIAVMRLLKVFGTADDITWAAAPNKPEWPALCNILQR